MAIDQNQLSQGGKINHCSRSHECLSRGSSIRSFFRVRLLSTKDFSTSCTRNKSMNLHSNPQEEDCEETIYEEMSTPIERKHMRPRQLRSSISARLHSLLPSLSGFRCTSMDILPMQDSDCSQQPNIRLASTPGQSGQLYPPHFKELSRSMELRRIFTNDRTEADSPQSPRNAGIFISQNFSNSSLIEPVSNEDITCTPTENRQNSRIYPTLIAPNPPECAKIQVKRLLGSGANGFCHEIDIQWTQNHGETSSTSTGTLQRAALKIIPFRIYESKDTAIQREIRIQHLAIHPNLLQMFHAYFDPRLRSICMVLEFCSIGTLADLVIEGGGKPRHQSLLPKRDELESIPESNSGQTNNLWAQHKNKNDTPSWNRLLHDPRTGGLSHSLARLIFRGLMRGLSYLHETLDVIHRDIKPSNILLTDGFVTKISDFGLACNSSESAQDKKEICGTPNYMAPEVFLNEGHSKQSDSWASGATLYFMLCGRPPFQTTPALEFVEASLRNYKSDPIDGNRRFPGEQVKSICRYVLWGRFEFPEALSQSSRSLIVKFLQRSPCSRPTATKVLTMDFCAPVINPTQQSFKQAGNRRYLSKPSTTVNASQNTNVNYGPSAISLHLIEDSHSTENYTRISETVYTGNEAIFDAFKLLSLRVRSPPIEFIQMYWVSRWALTTSPLLYYTLESMDFKFDCHATPKLIEERCPNLNGESWGVTNQQGQGLIYFKGIRLVQFESNTNGSNRLTTNLPSMVEVRTHCAFLMRQLKHFSPVFQEPKLYEPPCHPYNDNNPSPVFVQRWADKGNNLIFHFSTGAWQVNFYDHSKLIITYPYLLVHSEAPPPLSGLRSECSSHYQMVKTIDQLESEFRQWVASHEHLRSILQILLFTLL